MPAPAATPTGPSAFTQPGPYPVGTLEIDAPNGPITVWYPGQPGSEAGQAAATYDLRTYLPAAEQGKVAEAPFPMDAYPDLPAAEPEGQPFPLVLFSHGFCGYRQQSSFLTTTIASWGFVVAAPEHAARDLTACLSGTIGQGATTDVQDLRAAIPVLEAENLKEDGPLATIVDTTRLAVVGHSAGGSAAIQMSGDPNVATYVAMAAGNGPAPAATPGLYVAGDADVIAPAATIEQWWTTSVPSPKQLAVLGGVTHLGFMDLCTIAADQGGVFQVARALRGRHPGRHRPPHGRRLLALPHPGHDGLAGHPPPDHRAAAVGLRHRPGPRRARRVAGRRLPRPHRPLPVRLTAAPGVVHVRDPCTRRSPART